jgi:hypothetical protein
VSAGARELHDALNDRLADAETLGQGPLPRRRRVERLGADDRDFALSARGVADDWLKRVVVAAGSYAGIYARNLGDRSRLELPATRTRRPKPATCS